LSIVGSLDRVPGGAPALARSERLSYLKEEDEMVNNELPVSLGAIRIIAAALMAFYVVAMIVGTVKKPTGNAIIALVGSLAFIWFGWMLRTWPSYHKGDGMLWMIIKAWRDSVITTIWALFRLFGADQAWDRLFGQFMN
jgi:hypothetical protein